jgi:hypothetical protein
MRLDIDLSKNITQQEFFNTALASAAGLNDYRFIMTGGAIRGGKTIAALVTLQVLSAMYPGCRSVIYRKDFGKLKETTIPSMEKLVEGLTQWTWDKGSPYKLKYNNGSEIWFIGENIDRDPDLNDILGLECNFVLLEQCEELSEKLFNEIQTRIGSLILPKMPCPLIFLTVNPTQYWPKKIFYEPFRLGELKAPYYFINALTKHNTFVTEEQWKMYGNMDERYYRQMIEGDWTDMRGADDRWCYAFNRKKHLPLTLDPTIWDGDNNQYLYLSFDFNINPITCAVIQHYDETIYVLEQIKLANSDIYKLCERIKGLYPNFMYIVTGDATGQSSTAMVSDHMNYYKIIKQELNINMNQFKLPAANPHQKDNNVLVNALLNKYNVLIHPEKGAGLIYDMENVRMDRDKKIIKDNRSNEAEKSDCLDCFRYFCNSFLKHFITMKTIEE